MNRWVWSGYCIVVTFLLLTGVTAGEQGDSTSSAPDISADGRYVTFYSMATNLVSGDSNGKTDIFVRDRTAGATSLISKSTGGTAGNDHSYIPAISADGRFVTYYSGSTNLVSGDYNAAEDIFVRDRTLATTTLVSKTTAGQQADSGSWASVVSEDGHYCAFDSFATNLASGDTNDARDVFMRNRQTATTSLISKNTGGTPGNGISVGPSVSSDGRYVAFYSTATDLVSGDTNGAWDIFVRDRQTATTARISKSSGGVAGNGDSRSASISADGRYVAFYSSATNLVSDDSNGRNDIFVRDRQAGTTTRISKDTAGVEGDGDSTNPRISANGRFVAFESTATNLVAGDSNGKKDIFVRDRTLATTTLVSKSSGGTAANQDCTKPAISEDGRFVTFDSYASNLVTGDTNALGDVFVRDRQTATTTLVSKS